MPQGVMILAQVGWVSLSVIIGLISVQHQLNLPTGTEVGDDEVDQNETSYILTKGNSDQFILKYDDT